MTRYFAAWGTCIVIMLVLDAIWIGILAKPWYQQGIGHLMAGKVNVAAAAAFYLMYGVALMVFVVAPDGAAGNSWSNTLVKGALFGLFAYGTYDLTNLATLRDWPLGVSLMDMGWGSIASMAACAGAKWVFDHLAATA